LNLDTLSLMALDVGLEGALAAASEIIDGKISDLVIVDAWDA